MHRAIYLVAIILFIGCGSKKESFSLPENANTILAGESGKQWKLSKRYNRGYRMNMEGCFLSYQITYNPDGTFMDNNGQNKGCGDSLKGKWNLVSNETGNYIRMESPQIPEMMGINEDFKMMRILSFKDLEIQLQLVHEQFKESGKIIDYLVPIDVEVADRAFQN